MIKERVETAIKIMKRAGKFHMENWQNFNKESQSPCTTEKELHSCNTSACFAGWVACSPEFKKDGGDITYTGAPSVIDKDDNEYPITGALAIAQWLGIDEHQAELLCAVEINKAEYWYGKRLEAITSTDVIKKLESILDGSIEW